MAHPPAQRLTVEPSVLKEVDAQLITVGDYDLSTGVPDPTILIDCMWGRAMGGEGAVRILSHVFRNRLWERGMLYLPPRTSEERGIKKAAEQAGYDPAIVDVLRQGRLRMIFLINSLGGNMLFLEHERKVVEELRCRQADVLALTTMVAHSAGAEIFILAPREHRYALRETEAE